MAGKLDFTPRPYNPAEDDKRYLAKNPLEFATGIRHGSRLLQEANDDGVLDLLRGILHAGGVATTKAAALANSPSGINTARNLLAVGKTLGSVDADLVHSTIEDLTASVSREVALYRDRPPTLWATLRRALSPDALRGLSLLVTMMISVGRAAGRAKNA